MEAATSENRKRQSDYEEQALLMLEEKYEEEFFLQEFCGIEYLRGYYIVTCCPAENPDIVFTAKAACDGSYIEDTYVSAAVCNKAEQQIEENLLGLEGYLVIKTIPVSRNIESSDADMSVQEFMSMKTKNRFAVYLMYCPQIKNAEKVYAQISRTFHGLESMSGNILMYLMEEESLRQMQEYIETTAELGYEFDEMTKDVTCIKIPFEKGVVIKGKESFLEEVGEKV